MFDAFEDALIEMSRLQREACESVGSTFADMYPEEAESLRSFLATTFKTEESE